MTEIRRTPREYEVWFEDSGGKLKGRQGVCGNYQHILKAQNQLYFWELHQKDANELAKKYKENPNVYEFVEGRIIEKLAKPKFSVSYGKYKLYSMNHHGIFYNDGKVRGLLQDGLRITDTKPEPEYFQRVEGYEYLFEPLKVEL